GRRRPADRGRRGEVFGRDRAGRGDDLIGGRRPAHQIVAWSGPGERRFGDARVRRVAGRDRVARVVAGVRDVVVEVRPRARRACSGRRRVDRQRALARDRDHILLRGGTRVDGPQRPERRRGHRPVTGELGPRRACGVAFDVVGLQVLRGGTGDDLLFGRLTRHVADRLAGDEREVVVDGGVARRELAAVCLPGRSEVLTALLVVGRDHVERAQQPGNRPEEVSRRAVERAERGLAHGREGRRVGLAVARAEVGLQRVVLAFAFAVAGTAVGVQHVAGPGVRDHPDLGPFAAFGAVQRRDHRRAVDPLAYVGQQARVDDTDLDRPAAADRGGRAFFAGARQAAGGARGRIGGAAVGVERVQAAVAEREQAAEHTQRRRVRVRSVYSAFVAVA